MERWRLKISGLVQGVGFRPFLYNWAKLKGLTGWVRNNFGGVELEIQGSQQQLTSFTAELQGRAPETAVIEKIDVITIPVVSETEFVIKNSEFGQVAGSPIPDQGICPACTTEFFNPENRRFNHPFNSCTICGPRFTIIGDLPFDRARTTMAEFDLCPECLAEYNSTVDRRFHAQTIACPQCGPKLWFASPQGEFLSADPAAMSIEILEAGGIIGIKGVGGYHLACLASDEKAVNRLRELKGRDSRAFAVMFRDLAGVEAVCELNTAEAKILSSAARPILLLKQKSQRLVAKSVNPGLHEIGVFLPYTGIQLLLFSENIPALVMTSGNRSGEPLTIEDQEAFCVLGPMVDGFLGHNRQILWRCDDSVMRWQQGKLLGIRRSRGYAPAPLKFGRQLAPLIACGAQQKNVFALTKGEYIFLSPHQGDLDHLATFIAYQETISRFTRLLQCKPEWAVHDLHPDYNSTVWARNSTLKTVAVQHHIAHLAGVIAACGIKGPVIGVTFDGSGYGSDGKVWGGEFFYGQDTTWQRIGALNYYPLPGGEAAVREPWRMTAAYLQEAGPELLQRWLEVNGLTGQWATLQAAIKLAINTPFTSSMGRLFDGVAALIGGPLRVSYEGEAAIWLENQAETTAMGLYHYCIEHRCEDFRLDPASIMAQVHQDLKQYNGGSAHGIISMKFHRTIAAFIGEMAGLIERQTGYRQVVLSGGVFQNRLLLDLAVEILKSQGFEVFIPDLVPLNDGGIALGQAWLGNMMIERGISDVFSDSR